MFGLVLYSAGSWEKSVTVDFSGEITNSRSSKKLVTVLIYLFILLERDNARTETIMLISWAYFFIRIPSGGRGRLQR